MIEANPSNGILVYVPMVMRDTSAKGIELAPWGEVKCYSDFGGDEGHVIAPAHLLHHIASHVRTDGRSRPLVRGDMVNVLSITRGEIYKKNVFVVNEFTYERQTMVAVTVRANESVEDAIESGYVTEFPYHRIELVKPVGEEGGAA